MIIDRKKRQTSVPKKNKVSEGKDNKEVKRINIALQGGGSHGAYAWGVLDSLLENENISIEGLSGTSAGAMNATAVAMGLAKGGNQGARQMLKALWTRIGESEKYSFVQLDPLEKVVRDFESYNHFKHFKLNLLNWILCSNSLNPINVSPLKEIIEGLFDFKALQKEENSKLFLCATHVATGKSKIFKGKELTEEALLASCCLPTVFKAEKVNGEYYWDGGLVGNPPIYPLIYNCESPDILIIQLRRSYDPEVPSTIHDVLKRLGEITQNACLTREIRVIDFISKLIDQEIVQPGKLKRLHIHMIQDDKFFGSIERKSAWCVDPEFLQYLYKAGRKTGKKWLKQNFDSIGKRTTVTIQEEFN